MNSLTGILGGTALISVIIASWEKVKQILHRFYSLFVITIELSDRAAYAFSMWLIQNMDRSPLCDIIITGRNEYVRPKRRNQVVAFRRIPTKATIYRKGWRCLTVSRSWNGLKINFLRWVFDPHDLVLQAIKDFNEAEIKDNARSRFFVRRMQGTVGESSVKTYLRGREGNKSDKSDQPEASADNDVADRYNSEVLGWEFDDIGQPHNMTAIEMLSLSDDVLAACSYAKKWRKNEVWFKERNIPWKYGLAFEGIPGSGKTVTAKAIAQELNMPIFIFDLPTMSNQDFVEAWTDARDWAPCMVLFEDLDAVFELRKNITDTGMQAKLTFDCFLNILDGIENSEGIFTVITTNSISNLDPALSGNGQGFRPGRINRVIRFSYLSDAGKRKMATRILRGLEYPEWESILDDGNEYTGAQFQERCCERALELWEIKDNK